MRPALFIASSKESLHLAYALQENLEDDAEVTVWTQNVFALTESTLASLLDAIANSEFAVFVFADDDVAQIRSEEVTIPRDNVILELGVALGCLGRERTFFVVPKDDPTLHIPTDLAGITPARYDTKRKDRNWCAALAPATSRIRAAIQRTIPKPFDDELFERNEDLRRRIRSLLIWSITQSHHATEFPTEPELRQLPTDELATMDLEANPASLGGGPSVHSLQFSSEVIGRELYDWPGEEWQSRAVERRIERLQRHVAVCEGQRSRRLRTSQHQDAPPDST